LEDGGEVGCGHLVDIGFRSKQGEKIEDVEEKLAVQRRKHSDELLIPFDSHIHVKSAFRWALTINLAHCLLLVVANRVSESVVKVQRDDWFGQLVEVATKNVGGIVNRIAAPIQAFTVAIG